MIRYKASFKTPSRTDPLALDMQGMGKGQVWVKEQIIGRLWPSFITGNDGCSSIWDYRGAYDPSNCVKNCENLSQRWYHVFVKWHKHIDFANEGSTLELSCRGGHIISEVQFASYRNSEEQCGSFKQGSWDATNNANLVEDLISRSISTTSGVQESELSTSRENTCQIL